MENSFDAERSELRREDLYEQVWSKPMVRLAKRYGVSDVALAKMCRKMDVPVPSRGYWRRIETGRQPERLPLPKLRPGARCTVKLTIRPHHPAAAPAQDPEVEAQRAFEQQVKHAIRVPRQLVDPHPLVRHTAEVLRAARPGLYGTVGASGGKCLDVRVGPRSIERALRIMEALVRALNTRGFRVEVALAGKIETCVEILGQRVQIALEEKIRRTAHIRQKKEGYYPPKWDYTPSGELKIRIHEWIGGQARKTWSDGARGRLERKLNDVVLGLVTVAAAKRAWERERQREALARQEAERQRALAEQRRREEEERRRVLERQVESWTKSQQMRAFVDEVERRAAAKQMSTAPDGELGTWIVWARQHADRLDPLVRDLETALEE